MARELHLCLSVKQLSVKRMSVKRSSRARGSGFTLVELMIVVAIIGVLAALAIYGFKKYINSASTAEAKAVMQGVRAAEESYRAETLTYLGCSAFTPTRVYPQGMKPNDRKWHFINPAHADFPCWRRLNIQVDTPVRFGYAVVAGMPGTAMLIPPGFVENAIPIPAQTTEPWFVLWAIADRDDDNVLARAVTSSANGAIYMEDESE